MSTLLAVTAAEAVPPTLLRTAGAIQAGLLSAKVFALAQAVMPGLAMVRLNIGLILLFSSLAFVAGISTLGPGLGRLVALAITEEPPNSTEEPQAAAPQEQPKHLDRFGEPLPEQAVARLGTVRFRPGEHVFNLGFSPDGKRVITQGWGSVRSWDRTTGQELLRIAKRDKFSFGYMALSPCGKQLATVKIDGTTDLWDAVTGEHRRQLRRKARTVAFSPDGERLASSEFGKPSIRIWDARSGEELRQLTGHRDRVWTLAFSSDGKFLASGSSDKTIRFWNITTGQESQKSIENEHGLGLIALAPNGQTVAGIEVHLDNGKLPGFAGTRLLLWDVATGRKLHQFQSKLRFRHFEFFGTSYDLTSLTFSPDGGTVVTTEIDHALTRIDVATGKELPPLENINDHRYGPMTFSPDGKFAAAVIGNTLHFWDAQTGKALPSGGGHQGAITGLAFTPDGRSIVTASQDSSLREWETSTGEEKRKVGGNGMGAMAVVLSPDRKTAFSTHWDWRIHTWDLLAEKEIPRFSVEQVSPYALAMSPDGRLIAAACGNEAEICLWEAATGKEVRKLKGSKRQPFSLSFSSDGLVLHAWTTDRMLFGWDVNTGKELHRFPAKLDENPIETVVFSPDGRLAAMGGNWGTLALVATATGQEIRRWTSMGQGKPSLAFSADGRNLAWQTGFSAAIVIFELASGKERHRLPGHRRIGVDTDVSCLAFSPDGSKLATGHEDTTALVWPLFALPPHARSRREMESDWADLINENGIPAFAAMRRFVSARAPAVDFLREHLVPATPLGPEVGARLLADLDSNSFAVREKASADLVQLGERAGPIIREARAGRASLELRRRLERVEEQLARRTLSGETLRAVRAIEVLEHIGSSDAATLLDRLAQGAAEDRLTQEAKASLKRLRATN
jgi:WD40 repeat protein